MWKKPEPESITKETQISSPAPVREMAAAPATTPARKDTQPALLGPSLTFEGTISGAEDLIVQGCIKGTVDLKNNSVSIGRTGRIEGDVYALAITIEGEVWGNVFAGERAKLHKSGFVKGNIVSPRVTVEDGARLKGSIDVDSAQGTTKKAETKIITPDESDKKDKSKENNPVSIVL